MARKKNDRHDEEYERPTKERPVADCGHSTFVVTEQYVPTTNTVLSANEQTKRDLQRRFKAIFGYKPTGLTNEELRRMVEVAESA